MEFSTHGGHCCGIIHIHGMGDYPESGNSLRGVQHSGRNCLQQLITNLQQDQKGRVLEVVTSDERIEEDESEYFDTNQTDNWSYTLVEFGFTKVCSFLNSNSDNVCTVWHKHPGLTLYGHAPQPARPQEREALASVPAAPVVVLTDYFPYF